MVQRFVVVPFGVCIYRWLCYIQIAFGQKLNRYHGRLDRLTAGKDQHRKLKNVVTAGKTARWQATHYEQNRQHAFAWWFTVAPPGNTNAASHQPNAVKITATIASVKVSPVGVTGRLP